MTGWVILVDQARDFPNAETPHKVITTGDYLARPKLFAALGRPKIVNLSRSYNYQSKGYYASLLAEARGHRVIPTVETMLDLRELKLYEQSLPELQEALTAAAAKAQASEDTTFDLLFCFGYCRTRGSRLLAGSCSTGTAVLRLKSPSRRANIGRSSGCAPVRWPSLGRTRRSSSARAFTATPSANGATRAGARSPVIRWPSCTIRTRRCRRPPSRPSGISSGSPKSTRSRSNSLPASSLRNSPNSMACSSARRPRSTISPIASQGGREPKACPSSTIRRR